VANDRAPRMSTKAYASYIDRGAAAMTAAEVKQLRTELLQRWRGDPRAEDLAETLYAHEEHLAAREILVWVEARRTHSRVEGSRGTRWTA
jgi:hypothetical protein